MSAVLSTGLVTPEVAAAFFAAQLACRTDAADLASDLAAGVAGIRVIDTRSRANYQEGHIPGAHSLPHREMTAAGTAGLDRELVYVCYCDGIGCNGSTQGAYKLAALGFKVKELIGGLHWWQLEGYPLAQGEQPGQLTSAEVTCGC
ncbi:Rhodanese-related sulfurtransferase [Aeromonas sp. RU39B]|jgi:rhodanese-related sulfurtransferase|uniref:rhodanese-like domain-containing protein n=1 Tax=Aeromonas sp. RU39B TaxID=1907416 RepID=UPI000953F0ED|nr:rhodanese-like domain-containing protein [Aeromonas sp. RU39B]SIR28271.1 Rhodanese-related sulfurtransferase [Aeromonas sp. RU39B]